MRFGLAVLDYVITSNHIHMLVKDTGGRVIPQSIQLIAGRKTMIQGDYGWQLGYR